MVVPDISRKQYLLQLTITHPEYSHISPSGPGIQAETPLWIVTDAPLSHSSVSKSLQQPTAADLTTLPVTGDVVEVGSDAVRAPLVIGKVTTTERPTWHTQRLSAF